MTHNNIKDTLPEFVIQCTKFKKLYIFIYLYIYS